MSALKYVVPIALMSAVCAYPQAAAEYGLSVGRAGVLGNGANKTGKSVSDALSRTGKAADKATEGKYQTYKPSAPAPAKTAEAATVPPAPAAAPAIDPAAISEGMDGQEVLRKFGKPSMKITNSEGSDVVEKYWYKTPGRATVVITVRNGKVATVS